MKHSLLHRSQQRKTLDWDLHSLPGGIGRALFLKLSEAEHPQVRWLQSSCSWDPSGKQNAGQPFSKAVYPQITQFCQGWLPGGPSHVPGLLYWAATCNLLLVLCSMWFSSGTFFLLIFRWQQVFKSPLKHLCVHRDRDFSELECFMTEGLWGLLAVEGHERQHREGWGKGDRATPRHVKLKEFSSH